MVGFGARAYGSCRRITNFGFFLSIVLAIFAQGREKRRKVREESLVLKFSRRFGYGILSFVGLETLLTPSLSIFGLGNLTLPYMCFWLF